jgi:hypothetical protein
LNILSFCDIIPGGFFVVSSGYAMGMIADTLSENPEGPIGV